uniref:Uncharacterized protein n=1 Tax=Trypanosoma vivax (strain Y486) TaxID=1055687 RepID=G0UB67_TRYVY|nr:hypothetical protein, unlikely [Trypanosoma vivax Y486]
MCKLPLHQLQTIQMSTSSTTQFRNRHHNHRPQQFIIGRFRPPSSPLLFVLLRNRGKGRGNSKIIILQPDTQKHAQEREKGVSGGGQSRAGKRREAAFKPTGG